MRKIKINVKKVMVIFIMLVIMSTIFHNSNLYAIDFITHALDWANQGSYDPVVGDAVQSFLNNGILHIANLVGTLVITIATIILGIKYIIGSVEQKVQVKESLMNLLVACVLFFGWTNISQLLFDGTHLHIYTGVQNADDIAKRVFTIFKMVAEFVAVVAILYIGIKYILAGADGKAELKSKSWMFIIGIIMTFATLNLLTFVSNVITQGTSV